MLTAKYATEKRDKRGSVYWHCVCDCGNEVDVTAAGLVHGNYHSCGCLQKKNRQEIDNRIREYGEAAAYEIGAPNLHP